MLEWRYSVPILSAFCLLIDTLQANASTASSSSSLATELLVAVFVGTIALGIFLGLTERAIVFRDYDDLAIVFAFALCSSSVIVVADTQILMALVVIVAACLLGLIAFRTWQDNGIILLPIILLTKVPLSLFWILQLMQSINPEGKTHTERARNRGSAILFLLVLTPLIAKLIRNHEGFMSKGFQKAIPKDYRNG